MLPSLPIRDVTGDGRLAGQARGPRAELVTSFPGGSGHRPAGMMTGLRGASLDWDKRVRSNARIR